MRLTMVAIGSRGDVQPMLVVAQAARRRGHSVVLCAAPNFEGWIRRHDLEFHPLGDDIKAWLDENQRALSGNPLKMFRGFASYIQGQLGQQFAALAPAAVGSDAILFAGLSFSAVSVAEKYGIPALFVAYSSCLIGSPDHPPPMFPWQRMPKFLNRLAWRASQVGMRLAVGRVMNGGRRDLGLPPNNALMQVFRETPVVVAMDEPIFPAGKALFIQPGYANFPFYEDPAELDPDLDAWLREGEPPVFVGFGSMSGHGTARIARVLTGALDDGKRRVLVSAGWGGLGQGNLPSGWRAVSETPHAKLFPRCAVVVHHGGAGTLATALRAGVPQVLLPLILDQFHHAERLFRAGLAPAPTPMESVTEQQLADAVRAALAIPETRRQEVAERLRNSDGATRIVVRAEELVAARRKAAS